MNANRTRLNWSKMNDRQIEMLRDYGNTPAIRRRARQEIIRRAAERAKAEMKR